MTTRKQRLFLGLSTIRLKGLWIALCLGMCALMMTACASPMPLSVVSPRPPLPANLTQGCPKLSPLSEGTGGAVLRKLIEISEAYYECSRKQERLIEAIK